MGSGASAGPRILFVGRTRFALPLPAHLDRKFAALSNEMCVRVLGSSASGRPIDDGRFRLVGRIRPGLLDGLAFYAVLPLRVAQEIRRFRPRGIVAESPFEGLGVLIGRLLARSRVPVIVEVHGDWRMATRLYGSRYRRLLAPVTDWVARFVLRRADRVRAVSSVTADLVRELGREPGHVFPAYIDAEFSEFPTMPLPERPQVLFVGMLERTKNIDCLVDAWRAAAPHVPEASLRILGRGREFRLVEQLLVDVPEQTSWAPALSSAGIARALDDSSVLVLPSRTEGLPRVVLEALARGRPVVAARVGGVPDVVVSGVNGVLVEPEDAEALARTLVSLLRDRAALERLAAGCRSSSRLWSQTPSAFAQRMRRLVDGVDDRGPLEEALREQAERQAGLMPGDRLPELAALDEEHGDEGRRRERRQHEEHRR